MKKPEPTERERLQAEDDILSRLERESGETVIFTKGRDGMIYGEIGNAAARNDKVALAALAAEAAELPAKLRAAEAAYNGIRDARAPIAARLGELNRERIVSNFDSQRAELVATGEQSAAALSEWLLAGGRLVAERLRLCDEMEALRRQLAQYGVSVAQLPDFRAVIETANAAARSVGRVEPVEIRLPVPV